MTAPPTLEARLQRYVRYELSVANEGSGLETFEEFDDFEVDDEDDDFVSTHELTEDEEMLPPWNEADQAREAARDNLSHAEPNALGPKGGTPPTGKQTESEPAPKTRSEAETPSSNEATGTGT